ncbi:uncharacterized protein LOC135930112 [Gordionus sp. m RMFG-2023]|uniref:uncharacterized protein LOC135930112 n=1 Tax=Gordionus sp. m RMFG-2023 TaxID=3053472 RepID=UPI0031FD34C8
MSYLFSNSQFQKSVHNQRDAQEHIWNSTKDIVCKNENNSISQLPSYNIGKLLSNNHLQNNIANYLALLNLQNQLDQHKLYNKLTSATPGNNSMIECQYDHTLLNFNGEKRRLESISSDDCMKKDYHEDITNHQNNDEYEINKNLGNKMFCIFCKNNGEPISWFSTHKLKNQQGQILCPVLRKYVCPVCQASGDKAHTITYCPKRKKASRQWAIMKSSRIN